MDEMPSALPRSAPPRRTSGMLLVFLVLLSMLVAPFVAERVEYAITRGQLRAKAETAAAELKRLDQQTELVKLSDTSRAFRLVAERIEPSVVHIDTESVGRERGHSVFDEFFGFPEDGGRTYRAIGQGSGVIVDDKAGYIITNYHVIQDASQVIVKLSDGRMIDDVTLVGSDVLTDLAVLKIDAGNLIAAPFGDSNELEVGDWVLAVGNPYGLDRTVTCGIVSAKQRRAIAEQSAYQNFLQTDAAVNPGNSGGPLVSIRGEVIGITTAIVGKSYQGISFAIPSDTVRGVYEELIKQGSVTRGYVGVGLQELTPQIAAKLKLGNVEGVLVTGVQPGSPAEQAGLQPGDVIVEFNAEKVRDPAEVRLLVAGAKVGSKAKLKILREGRTITTEVTIAARKGAA
jgi:Do/DeqQ family serine protease